MKTTLVMKRKMTVLICVLALLNAGTPRCVAADPGYIAADVFVARPMCFLATVVGSAVFVVALPIAITSRSVRSTANALVVRPAQATFTRPLGDLQDLTDADDFYYED